MELSGTDFERHPSQIAVAKMVALRARLTALTFFRPSELLKFTVKLLNRPTLGVLVLNGLRLDWVWVIGDNPVNVAVCGNDLEQSNQERQLFEFDQDAVFEAIRGPVNVLEVAITLLLVERHQTVVVDRCEKDHFQEGNQLEVVCPHWYTNYRTAQCEP